MKHYNIPVFVPHMGCPHDCVFCSQKTITGTQDIMTPHKARKIIDKFLKDIKPEGYVEIAFFGGSFTGIPKPERIGFLEVASEYVKKGVVSGIRLSTRPDYITEEILAELKNYGVTAIELGVQSMDSEVLNLSGRGHDTKCVKKAVELIRKYPFELGLQMMTGLPGDTFEKSLQTAREFVKLKPDTVRIYPTLVIKGTVLEKMYLNGKYTPMTVEGAAELLGELKEIFDSSAIRIIRMGLQTTEEISRDGEVVAGPFHEAIGELAKSNIFLKKLYKLLENFKEPVAVIGCNNVEVSQVIGHKRRNAEAIYNKYKIKLVVIPDSEIDKGKLKILR